MVLKDEESILGKDHSFSSQMQNHLENGTFWYIQAVREPLCCLELMQSWSAEVSQPLETPVHTEGFVIRKFETCFGQSSSSTLPHPVGRRKYTDSYFQKIFADEYSRIMRLAEHGPAVTIRELNHYRYGNILC